ncbi:MAG: prevent-host-death family protein [Gemmatimonadetes bacterium RIFCSPLOWO2_02_FULL_71_11]|nr:MAG: prevent-host-death family protein [Gemmatimonadetes bacterium RIFCSPLOWO2_02_FULL_71_11]
MARLPTSKARQQLAEVLNRVAYGGERVVVERRGKGVAAVIPVEDLELLEALEDRYDVEAARAALAEKGRNVSWKKLKAELGL